MTADAGPARLLRRDDSGRWVPVGPPLPPYEDPDLHDLARDRRPHDYWILPVSAEARAGDVVVCREQTWRLAGAVTQHHHAWRELAAHAHATYVDAEDWLAGVQVWSVHAVDPQALAKERTP